MLTILFLIQAAAGPMLIQERRCTSNQAENEVVVCARRGDSPHRLKTLPPRPGDPPRDPLSFALPGGGQGRLHAMQSNLPSASGQGLAMTLRMPFGRKAKAKPAQ